MCIKYGGYFNDQKYFLIKEGILYSVGKLD